MVYRGASMARTSPGRGMVGFSFFGSFRRLSKRPPLPRLVYTPFYSVVSLTASHDSRWNAKNTVEGFSSPLSAFFPRRLLPVFLRYRCIGYCTNRSLLASETRNSRSSQDDEPFSSQVCQPGKKRIYFDKPSPSPPCNRSRIIKRPDDGG